MRRLLFGHKILCVCKSFLSAQGEMVQKTQIRLPPVSYIFHSLLFLSLTYYLLVLYTVLNFIEYKFKLINIKELYYRHSLTS